MVASGLRGALSETESTDCLNNYSIQAQIQQAKALAQASRNILAQNEYFTQSLQRGDSMRTPRASASNGNASTAQPHTLPRTGSGTQIGHDVTDAPAVNGVTSSNYANLRVQSRLARSRDDDRELQPEIMTSHSL